MQYRNRRLSWQFLTSKIFPADEAEGGILFSVLPSRYFSSIIAAMVSMPSQRLPRRMFSFSACWLLS